jgi:hypothetical protein
MSNMKAAVLIGLSIVMTISSSAAANATPVLVGTTTDPTGINDLVVDGTTYDVTFSTTTFNSFTAGTTLSQHAASALTAALNTLSVTELANFNVGATGAYFLDVDNTLSGFDNADCFRTVVCWATGTSTVPNLGSSDSGMEFTQAADFTAVPTTPLPAALPLFATGLGALGLLGWRRKRKTQAVA